MCQFWQEGRPRMIEIGKVTVCRSRNGSKDFRSLLFLLLPASPSSPFYFISFPPSHSFMTSSILIIGASGKSFSSTACQCMNFQLIPTNHRSRRISHRLSLTLPLPPDRSSPPNALQAPRRRPLKPPSHDHNR